MKSRFSKKQNYFLLIFQKKNLEPGIRGRGKKSTKNNLRPQETILFFVDFFFSGMCADKHHVIKKTTKNNIVATITQVAFKFGERAVAIGVGFFVFILKDVACAQEF